MNTRNEPLISLRVRDVPAALRLLAVFLLAALPAYAQRQMEKLGRGVVAMRSSSTQTHIGWRLLATDPDDIGFNLYRAAGGVTNKLNSNPLTNTTDYTDTPSFSGTNSYFVRPVLGGVEQASSGAWTLPTNPPTRQYFSVPLHAVTGGAYPPYDVKFCWVGDLDGDGEYDFVVDRLSTTGSVNQYLQAYKWDGTFLWQMDMGYNSTNQYNIEPGASAISTGDKDNVTVYDLDGDGRAEVIVRVARGTVLPDGTVVTGPDDTTQYLSVLDGVTGKERARATIPNPWPADGPMNFRFGILFCDGVRPSVLLAGENRNSSQVFQRICVAWDFRNGQLTQRWFWTPPANSNYAWSHQLRIADVNHDGIDDIVEIGSVNNGATGQPLFDTELLHGDRLHISDLDPDRPGLETYVIQQQNPTLLATALYDSATGKFIKKWYSPGIVDVGRGIALDLDPNHRGCEMYSTQPGIFDCKGNQIFANNLWAPEGLWWDADLSREFIDGAGSGALNPVVNKFNPGTGGADRMYTIYNDNGGVHQAYGGRPAFWGDIFGDWREELVLVANDYSEIRIYTTTLPATNRIYCLMQNPAYRCQATVKGYYEACYPDYYLGTGMESPPPPPISDAKLTWRGGGANTWDTGSKANWFSNNLWISNTTPVGFSAGDTVLFDLTGSNNIPVSLLGTLTPGAVKVHSPADYVFAGDGSLAGGMKLTKAGGGKLVLSGTNTFTGATTVWEGPLVVNGSLPSSPVSVRSGAWLDAAIAGTGFVGGGVTVYRNGSVSPGAATNLPGTLAISNGLVELDGCFNRFHLSDDPTGALKTNDLVAVLGNLTLTGTNNIVITPLNTNLPPGSVYPLFTYSGNLVGSIAGLNILGLDGIPVALTNPPGMIGLVVKSCRAPAAITWTGGSGGNTWNLLASTNWLAGVTRDWFAPNDAVRFDNTGATNPVVTLSGTLNPASVVVDSASNYTFTGAGALIGSCTLAKSNSGTLTINAANNAFTGRTLIAGGTMVVSELDAVGFPSALGNPPGGSTNLVLTGNATLRVTSPSYTDRGMTLGTGTNTLDVTNSSDQLTVAAEITGSGALRKAGGGTLALTVSNSYSGGTIINGGSVALGSATGNSYGLGSGGVTLTNGILSMMDIQASETAAWSLNVPTNATGTLNCDGRCTLSGPLTGGGALTVYTPYVRTDFSGDWSKFTGQILVTTDSDGGDFRCNNSAGYPTAKFNLANLTTLQNRVSGTPTLSIGELSGAAGSAVCAPGGNSGVAVNWSVGGLNSSVTYAGNTYNGVGFVKVGTGTWTWTGTNISHTGQTTVNNGTLQFGSGGTTGSPGPGTITDNAALAFNRSDALSDTNFGIISGTGSLAKRGAGTLTLSKSHTFGGATTIEAGALALVGAGSIASSSNITVSAGALFDVSGRSGGAMSLAAGKMISGGGSVKGDFIIGSGARLAPGTNSMATLTFSNSLTLAAGCTSFFELSKSPLTNDAVKVVGALTYGGALVVTNIGSLALAAGDTFKLFSAAPAAGVFSGVVPSLPAAGLRWDTNSLAASGVLKVVAAPTPQLRGITQAGGWVVITGAGEINGTCYLLASTNMMLSLTQWTRLATNQFDAGGNLSFTNSLDANLPQRFYLLQVP